MEKGEKTVCLEVAVWGKESPTYTAGPEVGYGSSVHQDTCSFPVVAVTN